MQTENSQAPPNITKRFSTGVTSATDKPTVRKHATKDRL